MTFPKEEIKAQWQKLNGQMKNFLQSSQCREFLIFLFFVIVASTFWLLHTLNETYETELSVPLRMKNVPENVVVTSDLPKELEVTVKDRGTVLVNYLIGMNFMPLTVDFEDYKHRNTHIRLLSTELQKKLLGQLAVSTSVVSIKPDTLEFIYTQGEGRMLPVKVRGNIQAKKQYYLVDKQFSPDSVMVYAPQKILDTLRAAYTEPLHLKEVTDTIRQMVDLSPIKGVKFVPDKGELVVYADVLTEKTVTVPVKGVGFPANKQLKTFPSKVNVTFLVGRHNFKSITADDFSIEVHYKELVGNRSDKCRLELTQVPVGASHVKINPEQVDYLIEETSLYIHTESDEPAKP